MERQKLTAYAKHIGDEPEFPTMLVDGWAVAAAGEGATYKAGSWHDQEFDLHVLEIACDPIPVGNLHSVTNYDKNGPCGESLYGGFQAPFPNKVAVYPKGQTDNPLDLTEDQHNGLCQLACEEQGFMARLDLYFAWHGAVRCIEHYGGLPKGWTLRYTQED